MRRASHDHPIGTPVRSTNPKIGTTTATEANLTRALDLARDCHAAYLAASPFLRRLFNQAFLTHLMIDEDGIRGEYAEPFDTLLDSDVLDAGRSYLADDVEGQARLREVLERPAAPPASIKKTPSELAGGLPMHLSIPIRGVEGSTMSTLVPPAGFEPATPAFGGQQGL